MAILHLFIVPRSSKDEFVQEEFGVKLKITAPPIDGAANKYVINLLSKLLSVPKSSISLKNGHKSKFKTFLIHEISQEQVDNIIQTQFLKRSYNA